MFSKILQNIRNFFAPKPPPQVSKPLTQQQQQSIPRNVSVQLGPPKPSTNLSLASRPPVQTFTRSIPGVNVNLGPSPANNAINQVQQVQSQQPQSNTAQRAVEQVLSAVTPSAYAAEEQNMTPVPKVPLPAPAPRVPLTQKVDFGAILRAARQAAGNVTEAVGTFLTPGIARGPLTNVNPFEFGLSERIAGGPTRFTGKPGAFGFTPQSQQTQYGRQLPDDINRSVDTRIPGSSQTDPRFAGYRAPGVAVDPYAGSKANLGANYGQVQTGLQNLEGEATKISKDLATDENVDLYGLFDKDYAEVARAYDSNEITLEEAQRRQAQIEQDETNAIYDRLVGEQKALVPQYESLYKSGEDTLKDYLKETKAEGEKVKGTTTTKYGELLKGITQRKNVSTTQLKNIFSALGTADSSEFLNRAFKLEEAAGTESAATEREMMDKLANIDTEVRRVDTDVQRRISDLIADKNTKVNAVLANVNISQEQKARELRKVTTGLQTAIDAIKQDTVNKKADLLLTQRAALDARKNILAQGEVDADLLKRQFDFESRLGGIVPNVGLSEDDVRELKTPRSSMRRSRVLAELESKFPNKVALIRQLGGADPSQVDELLRQIQA